MTMRFLEKRRGLFLKRHGVFLKCGRLFKKDGGLLKKDDGLCGIVYAVNRVKGWNTIGLV